MSVVINPKEKYAQGCTAPYAKGAKIRMAPLIAIIMRRPQEELWSRDLIFLAVAIDADLMCPQLFPDIAITNH